MPPLDDVYDALRTSLRGNPPNQTIDLWEAAQKPALAPLQPMLERFGIAGAYVLTAADLTKDAASVLLTGNGQFGVPGAAPPNVSAVSARLDCRLDESGTNVVFDLGLAVTDSAWTFAKTFPVLPPTLSAAEAATVEFKSSFLVDPSPLALIAPVFSTRSGEDEPLRLTGSLPPGGALTPYQGWFDPWPLVLTGTVTLPASPADPPELELQAVVPGDVIDFPPVALRDPGVGLRTVTGVDEVLYGVTAFSELDLVGTVVLGRAKPIEAHLSAPLLVSGESWKLTADFPPEQNTLTGGLAAIAELFGLDAGDLLTPPALGGFETFYVAELEVWLRRATSSGLPSGVDALAVTIASNKLWEPPIPFVKVKGVGTRWGVTWVRVRGETQTAINGSVFGGIVLGSGANPPVIDIAATLPQFVVTGVLDPETPIPLGGVFEHFFNLPPPPTTPGGTAITGLNLLADPRWQTFAFSAEITTNWEISFFGSPSIALTDLNFGVAVTQSTISGYVEGIFRIGLTQEGGPDDPTFYVRAEYPGGAASGWIFSGGLYPGHSLDLVKLVTRFLGVTPPPNLPTLNLVRLEVTFATADSTWTLAGTVTTTWSLTVLDTALDLAAGVSVDLAKTTAGGSPQGKLAASFSVNRLSLRLSRDIGIEDPSYVIRVQFDQLWLQASTAWRESQKSGRHQVLVLQLGGVTLGGVLEYLVNLAAPTIGFTLEAPWNILERIDLSRFALTIDVKDRAIALTYDVPVDLVVMNVQTIGVRYELGSTSGVDLILTGRVLGEQKTLKWDVVNDPPPAVPGKGGSLLDLKYLGLGQHVRLADPQPDTVKQTIDRLIADMRPVDDPTKDPLPPKIVFDSGSQWLIGLNISLLETVDLAVIFNDPRLYGLSVGLRGERAGPLAGLRFEVLYKRITDDVGMFRIELQVPDAFRRIELGSVSVTLGIIVLEVYTNGNFFVDLGFPYERRFERSFSVQAFPFIGRGGFYFGLLDGNTSRRIPRISNGTFSPVLELGIGLAIGVGKEVSYGVLRGGAYVQVEVVFQGVLGWFNPSSSGLAPAKYWWGQGIAAIHGKVYGQVDFKVIKVSVTIEAYAQATVVFESYKATLFRLTVRVSVEAEVKVLFFTVSFTFRIGLDMSFTVGTDQPTPWVLAPTQGQPTAARLAHNALPALGRAPHRLTALQREQAAIDFVWDPTVRVFPDSPRSIGVSMLPAFSITGLPVDWTGQPPPNPNPDFQAAYLLFAANGVPASARSAAEVRAAPAAEGDPPLAAAELVEALLRWSLSALRDTGGQAGVVTAGMLELLAEEMNRPEVADEAFKVSTLDTFFETNLHVAISGQPPELPDPVGGMLFPAPPYLVIDQTPGGKRDLSEYNEIGPLYAHQVAEYMAEYSPVGGRGGDPPTDEVEQRESFAKHVFRDWCLLVAKAALREARGALGQTTVAAGKRSLADVAASLPRDTIAYVVQPGDTLDGVAAYLGASVPELEYLNPNLAAELASAAAGDTLTIVVGVAPQTLAIENAEKRLAPNVRLALGRIRVQARDGDTLDAIGQRLLQSAGWLLTAAALADDRRLLRPGAGFTVPQRKGPLPGLTNVDLVAGILYVRYFADTDAPAADWYAQTIAVYNPTRLDQLPYGQPLPAGISLTVPARAYSTETTTYTTIVGDTLLRIGAALSLAQNPAAYDKKAWQDFLAGISPADGVTVPATPTAILPGESLDLLAGRLALTGGATAVLPWVEGARVLSPLAVLDVDGLDVSSSDVPTLAEIAAAYGLSLADLAAMPTVETTVGLFPEETELDVSHLPAQTVDALVAEACSGASLGAISSDVSRQMLAGLRLPAPVENPETHEIEATGPLTGLAVLSGQQLPAPTPDPSQPDAIALEATVSLTAFIPGWLSLNEALSAPPGSLSATVPGATVPSFKFEFTNSELDGDYPARGLGVKPDRGPEAMRLAGEVPRTYGLDHRIELQAAVALAIPSRGDPPVGGNPSLWPFPDALLAKARAAGTTPFELVHADNRGSGVADHLAILDSTFGTVVPFTIRRVPGYAHLYELLGAQVADRDLLLSLAQYVDADPQPPKPRTQGYLLVAPTPDAGNPSGLAVLGTSPADTFVIRANLATDVPLSRPPAVLSASFGELGRFVRLLWEASVAGSGYYLEYRAADGQDLPAGSFAADGSATLRLLAIPRDQQQPPDPGRPLLAIDNCALLGPAFDPTAHALYAEASDVEHHPEELVKQALVPAGSVGLTLTLPRALPPNPLDPPPEQAKARLMQLFSLLQYSIKGATYEAEYDAPPITPQSEDGQHLPLWQRERLVRRARLLGAAEEPEDTPANWWRYDEVVPVTSFGPDSAAPAVAALPAPAGDPYRGFGAASSLPQATFELGFGDVLGNVTVEPFSKPVTADVGYTDPLVGVGGFPAVTSSYGVARATANGPVTLAVTVAPQPAAVVPAPGDLPALAAENAARQAARYREIWFQLVQPTLRAEILTTLSQDGKGQPNVLPTSEGTVPLRQLAAASYVYSAAAASLVPVDLTTQPTLAALLAEYGLTPATVAQANAEQRFGTLFTPGQPLTVPAYVVLAENDTPESIWDAIPSGWPKPASASALLQLPENADDLPLRPGTVLVTEPVLVAIGHDAPTLSLEDVAGQHLTTPAQLAIDVAPLPVLAEHFEFEWGGYRVAVDDKIRSFADVQQAFAAVSVDVSYADLAQSRATTKGIFAIGAELTLHHVVAGTDATLRTMAASTSLSSLADHNTGTPNLFDAGALVGLGDWAPQPVVPQPKEDTLAQFAARHGTTPALLLAANTGLTLAPETELLLPGIVQLPPGPVTVPYALMANDTLDLLATQFGGTAASLASANGALPGTLTPDKEITVTTGGGPVQTKTVAGDSFESVFQRLQAESKDVTFDATVQAIAATAGYLEQGGLLLVPAPALAPKPPSPGVPALTAAQVEQAYGVQALSFAKANAAVVGVLAVGVDLEVESEGRLVQVTTGPSDTLNAVVVRFAAKGAQVGVAEVLAANPSAALFRTGGRALLPPVPVSVSASIGTGDGPFAAPAFPLVTTLRLQRDEVVVDPEFKTPDGDGPVERSDTLVPAPAAPKGSGSEESLTFDAFVDECLAALPKLRLATAKVGGESADLWVVDFGPNGISSVAVTPGVTYPTGVGPRYFALRPLYSDLVSRAAVPVPTLDDEGRFGKPVDTDFQGVDAETWARRFLADMDLFLAAPYAAAIYREARARPALEKIQQAKWTLAGAIADGLGPVLSVTDAKEPRGRDSAITDLARQCAVTLARGYEVSTVVQYDAAVTSPYGKPPILPARLGGGGQPSGRSAEQDDFSLTTAQTALDTGDSFVSFAMTVPDPAFHETIAAEIDYVYDSLEMNIDAVHGSDGYVESSWLSFVRPLDGSYRPSAIPPLQDTPSVPVPLRNYPAVPLVLGQSAEQTFTGPDVPSLDQVALWTFGVTYSHEHAAQDEVILTVDFNVRRAVQAVGDPKPDVARELARYAGVADRLGELMSWYVTPPDPPPANLQAVRDNVASSFADLAEPIAEAWKEHWKPLPSDETPHYLDPEVGGSSYRFRLSISYKEDAEHQTLLDKLTVALEPGQDGPGPTGAWPDAYCRLEDGSFLQLEPLPNGGRELVYAVPEPVPAAGWPVIRLEWPGLNIAAIEDGRAQLSVQRNERLVPGVDTSRAFVFTTATIKAPDVAVPLNQWAADFPLEAPDLAHALQGAFGDMFASATGMPLTVGVSYGYQLVPPGPEGKGLRATLPVALYPSQPLGASTGATIAAAVEEWRKDNLPAEEGGEWVFSVSLYSGIDPTATRPLLVLERLVYPISAR